MADFPALVPHVSSQRNNAYLQRYMPKLEQCGISTIDLLTLDPAKVSRLTQISLGDARRLIEVISEELDADSGPAGFTAKSLLERQRFVSTGDERLDEFFEGGFLTGNLSEIVGESGVGKSQFLLTLLLTIQLPPCSKSSIYISTETQMSTPRLVEIMAQLSSKFPSAADLSLDRVHTITCQYLETLEHVVQYQLPVAVERFGVGLVVIDSMAANFRGGEGGNRAKALAQRNAAVVKLGRKLKDLAVRYELAVVVSNQVADRFVRDMPIPTMAPPPQQQQPLSASQQQREQAAEIGQPQSQGPSQPSASQAERSEFRGTPPVTKRNNESGDDELLTLDYQQQWFTGWGDDTLDGEDPVLTDPFKWKTPALGFVWANVISARIALLRGSEGLDGRLRRWVKVVFAPWAPSGRLLEYEIWEGGVRAKNQEVGVSEHVGAIQQTEGVQQQQVATELQEEFAYEEDTYSIQQDHEGHIEQDEYLRHDEEDLKHEQPLGAQPGEQPSERPQSVDQPAESQPEEVDLVKHPQKRRFFTDDNENDPSKRVQTDNQLPRGPLVEVRISMQQDPAPPQKPPMEQHEQLKATEDNSSQRPRKQYSDEIADSQGDDEFDDDFFDDI